MIRIDCPLLATNALMAGFGPTYEASRAPALTASTAAVPALKVCRESLVLPRAFWRKPCLIPTSAVACVRFGK